MISWLQLKGFVMASSPNHMKVNVKWISSMLSGYSLFFDLWRLPPRLPNPILVRSTFLAHFKSRTRRTCSMGLWPHRYTGKTKRIWNSQTSQAPSDLGTAQAAMNLAWVRLKLLQNAPWNRCYRARSKAALPDSSWEPPLFPTSFAKWTSSPPPMTPSPVPDSPNDVHAAHRGLPDVGWPLQQTQARAKRLTIPHNLKAHLWQRVCAKVRILRMCSPSRLGTFTETLHKQRPLGKVAAGKARYGCLCQFNNFLRADRISS